MDASGDARVVGTTQSANFPLIDEDQATHPGAGPWAFVTKFSPGGVPYFSTYLGGSALNQGTAIAVDAAQNTLVTGFTTSSDFPLYWPEQMYPTGSRSAFVTKYVAGPSSAPRNLHVVSASGGEVELAWDEPLADDGLAITGYQVYRGTSPTSKSLVVSGGCSSLGNVLTCTDDDGLLATDVYYYQVTAVVSSTAESAFSNEVVAGAPCAPVLTVTDGAPVHVSGGPNYQAQVRLTWPMPCDHGLAVSTFWLAIQDPVTHVWGAPSNIGLVTSWTDPSLSAVAKTCYRLYATNSWGDSPLSNVACSNAFLPL